MVAKTAPATQAPAQPDRKAIRASALAQAVALVTADGADRPSGQIQHEDAIDALRDMVAAFSPRSRAGGGPRVVLDKAAPADVAAYFVETGLTRKELAAAAEVSTSVIATVQNEKGDRWSTVTFAAKKLLIATWMRDHAQEIATRQAAEAAEVAARQAKIDAKAARAAAPKPAPKAAAPKAAAKATSGKSSKATAAKPGRPSAAARQANRKARPQLSVVQAQA